MQILHPFPGSVQQYIEQLDDPDSYRPGHCPQCPREHSWTAHGFDTRTLIDTAFDGVIRVRRYLCQTCQRTVSLLPEFVLPYLRSSLAVIALFSLITSLLLAQTLNNATRTASLPMPYQRGQFWIRRFRAQAETLCAALAALTKPAPRSRLRRPRSDHAPVHRAGSPLTASCSAACAATCWAGLTVWLLQRPPGRIVHRRRARLSCPTHHLHGTARPFSLTLWNGRKLHG